MVVGSHAPQQLAQLGEGAHARRQEGLLQSLPGRTGTYAYLALESFMRSLVLLLKHFISNISFKGREKRAVKLATLQTQVLEVVDMPLKSQKEK